MKDYYIFDIPVYVCEKVKYYAEMDKYRENHFKELQVRRDLADLPREMSRTDMIDEEQCVRSEFGGPWNFNNVIGWIRLYATTSTIGGNLWRVEGKRLRRKMKSKSFWEVGGSNILPTFFAPNVESKQIYSETLQAIKDISKENNFLKKRSVDLENFRNLGPFIDWRKLMDSVGNVQI